MKLFYFDLETTGLNFWQHGIHQIAGAIEVDGELKEQFNIKVKPNPKAKIEDESLSIAGIDRQTLEGYIGFNEGYRQLVGILSKYVDKYDKTDKFFLVGYNNAQFDNQFLRAFFTQNNDNYFGSWFWSNTIDVMVLATQKSLKDRKNMTDFKLKTVATHFGTVVDESRLHDALYDIELTMNIYKAV
jgi:DNA polymerase-3 subunit epsilon